MYLIDDFFYRKCVKQNPPFITPKFTDSPVETVNYRDPLSSIRTTEGFDNKFSSTNPELKSSAVNLPIDNNTNRGQPPEKKFKVGNTEEEKNGENECECDENTPQPIRKYIRTLPPEKLKKYNKTIKKRCGKKKKNHNSQHFLDPSNQIENMDFIGGNNDDGASIPVREETAAGISPVEQHTANIPVQDKTAHGHKLAKHHIRGKEERKKNLNRQRLNKKKVWKEKTNWFICTYCHQKFRWKNQLIKHNIQFHPIKKFLEKDERTDKEHEQKVGCDINYPPQRSETIKNPFSKFQSQKRKATDEIGINDKKKKSELECVSCHSFFKSPKSLKRHEKAAHDLDGENKKGDKRKNRREPSEPNRYMKRVKREEVLPITYNSYF
jgi:hypothetical protein